MSGVRTNDGKVVLSGGHLQVICDPLYGGAPLTVTYKGIPLINSFPGAGAQATWDFGQDSTQASPNGPLPSPIHTLQGKNEAWQYYGNEEAFSSTGFYGIKQYCPSFWLSFDAIDDSIPDEYKGGWRTRYLTPNYIPNWSIPETPIFWAGTPTTKTGMLFIGDEIKADMSLPWANRLASYRDGNVAAKIRISLKNSSPDAYAGIVFRKSVPENANAEQAYLAPGLMFCVNKKMEWNLHQFPDGSPIVGGILPSNVSQTLLTDLGGELEIRTYEAAPRIVQLYFEDFKIADLSVADTSIGGNFGVIAYTQSGHVAFNNRYVYDRNFTLRTLIQTYGSTIGLNYILQLSAFTADPSIHKLYRANLGVFFAEPSTFKGGWAEAGGQKNPGIISIANVPPPYSLVYPEYKLKLNVDILAAMPAGAHALIQGENIHLNNLPYDANQNPVPVFYENCYMNLSVTELP